MKAINSKRTNPQTEINLGERSNSNRHTEDIYVRNG